MATVRDADDGFVPLPHVPTLIEGAVRTASARVAPHVGQVGPGGVGAVRSIRHRPGRRTRGLRVRARRVVEVARPVEIGRLVPLVLAGEEDRGSRVPRDRVIGDPERRDRVGPVLCRRVVLRSRRLPVVEPVRKAQRVVERHVVHRLVLAAGDRAVRVAAEAPLRVIPPLARAHVRVVEPVGVGRRYRIQELLVLGVRDLLLPDLVFVRHRSVASGIGSVARIARRSPS